MQFSLLPPTRVAINAKHGIWERKTVINLSLKYYLADSNGIISAFYGTHDGFNFFKGGYTSQYCVAVCVFLGCVRISTRPSKSRAASCLACISTFKGRQETSHRFAEQFNLKNIIYQLFFICQHIFKKRGKKYEQ